MKKSIRGNIKVGSQLDKDNIISDINKQTLWKLQSDSCIDEDGNDYFVFEVWLNTVQEESMLWDDMKKHVDTHGGKSSINRHDCTHDEVDIKPCKVLERYEVN